MATQTMIKELCLYLDLSKTFLVKALEKKDLFKILFTSEECLLCHKEGLFFKSLEIDLK